MRTKRVWRYYCDHCNKGGCSKGHMAKHERGCSKNPNRECGFCKLVENAQKPTASLIKAYMDGGLSTLREESNNCPGCMLAGVVQSTKGFDAEDWTAFHGDGEEFSEEVFDFKKERETWFDIYNAGHEC